jgi:hypothetical protein
MTEQQADLAARIAALADKWKDEAAKAAVRSTSDSNAYLRMTIYDRVERETRVLVHSVGEEPRRFTADEVIQMAEETSDSLGNLYRLDFIDRVRHEAGEDRG